MTQTCNPIRGKEVALRRDKSQGEAHIVVVIKMWVKSVGQGRETIPNDGVVLLFFMIFLKMNSIT